MKSTCLLFFLAANAVVAPVKAFTSLPLSAQSLLVTGNSKDVRQRQQPAKPSQAPPALTRGGHQQGKSTVLQSSTTSSKDASSSFLSEQRKAQLMLLFRSSFCALSSVTTWAMVQHAGLTIVQASALQGLAACCFLPKPYAMAWFCGSFAGMSAQPAALDEAALLAAACTALSLSPSAVYAVAARQLAWYSS